MYFDIAVFVPPGDAMGVDCRTDCVMKTSGSSFSKLPEFGYTGSAQSEC